MTFTEGHDLEVPKMQDPVPADAIDPKGLVQRESVADGERVTLQYSGLRVPALARVLAIKDRTDGKDIITGVLEDAADEESPLHPYFEWDDGEAGAQYRRMQAYGLVRRVKVTVTPISGGQEPITVPALVAERSLKNVEGVDYKVGNYVPAESLTSAAKDALDERVKLTIGRLRNLVKDRDKALRLVAEAYESDDE